MVTSDIWIKIHVPQYHPPEGLGQHSNHRSWVARYFFFSSVCCVRPEDSELLLDCRQLDMHRFRSSWWGRHRRFAASTKIAAIKATAYVLTPLAQPPYCSRPPVSLEFQPLFLLSQVSLPQSMLWYGVDLHLPKNKFWIQIKKITYLHQVTTGTMLNWDMLTCLKSSINFWIHIDCKILLFDNLFISRSNYFINPFLESSTNYCENYICYVSTW